MIKVTCKNIAKEETNDISLVNNREAAQEYISTTFGGFNAGVDFSAVMELAAQLGLVTTKQLIDFYNEHKQGQETIFDTLKRELDSRTTIADEDVETQFAADSKLSKEAKKFLEKYYQFTELISTFESYYEVNGVSVTDNARLKELVKEATGSLSGEYEYEDEGGRTYTGDIYSSDPHVSITSAEYSVDEDSGQPVLTFYTDVWDNDEVSSYSHTDYWNGEQYDTLSVTVSKSSQVNMIVTMDGVGEYWEVEDDDYGKLEATL